MNHRKIAIKDFFNTDYLATREAAKEIVETSDGDTIFDFTNVMFASSSFVDEFISQLEERDLSYKAVASNVNPSLRKLFQAVQRRRRSRVSA